jgi:hypothetical protein
MIFVGKVEFFKLSKAEKLPLCFFKAGSMFGHARIKVAGALRTACAVTASECWLLTVDAGKLKFLTFRRLFELFHY